MIEKCHEAGVGVITDTGLNHLTRTNGIGKSIGKSIRLSARLAEAKLMSGASQGQLLVSSHCIQRIKLPTMRRTEYPHCRVPALQLLQ